MSKKEKHSTRNESVAKMPAKIQNDFTAIRSKNWNLIMVQSGEQENVKDTHDAKALEYNQVHYQDPTQVEIIDEESN